MFAKRRDSNHAEIRTKLRAAGVVVWDTGSAGGGLPDLIAKHRRTGEPIFLEIKDGKKSPSRRRLTKGEATFALHFHVFIVLSVEDAMRAVGVTAEAGGRCG